MAYGTPTLGTRTVTKTDSTPTLNLPSHSTGDILFAVCATRPGSDVLITSIDQSYVEIATQIYTSNNLGELTIFAKVAGASEAAPTVTLSGTPGDFIAFMLSVSGGPTSISVASDLVDNSQVKGYTDANASSFTNTVTPAVDGDLILWATVRATADWAITGTPNCTIPEGATLLTTDIATLNWNGGTVGNVCLVIAYEIQTTKTTRAEWNQKFTSAGTPGSTSYCMIGAAFKAGATTGTATMGRCIYILP